MSNRLQGKKVLVITSDTGIERDELIKPVQALQAEGASVVHASSGGGTTQTFVGDTEKDTTVKSTQKLAQVNAADYDALVIPGGTVNADTLRQDSDAQALVKAFADAGKTVAAICHGPWLLINAGVVEGKTLTSYPSVSTDLKNAKAAAWVDAEVKQCGANGWTLITSRNPNDLPAFNEAITQALEARKAA
ncbi:type 1 glutamine amidotransferase domain-containing protein [Pseudomonas typographi]|uniref:Type 1 glutamine amidotransferase n=1 Tax=Pseudomonas typographi TaxID=2715964 RepID=A0ABR7Z1E9_9PSED|nr:type 1 glutamine amidotransferase domain-containing protein [Pseudomonas typographi]MBD1551656.1 type 1 glutamine amidotransferase [Pseudomonas typographi]MBD1587090.1 type 1 glutamine amidotransferase [Pseudomonas typographi]MBD1599326.1 type 1 glutamine amidotransferase [Pseudomonas typographi]